MKILLVSDLHYALKQYDWTAATSEDMDLVIIAGDHLDIAGHLGGDVQIVVILNYLRRMAARGRLIVSSGNHDLDARNADGEKVASWMRRVRAMGIPTDGDTVDYDGVLVTVCAWWDGPATREAVRAQLERDAATPKRRWLWVYHAPPDESPTSWTGRRHWGDVELTAWIGAYQPDMVFTGHIHEAPFRQDGSWFDRIGQSWVFNAGQQIGPTPCHVIIDTEAGEAAWFSMAGAELISLDAELRRPAFQLDALPAWLATPRAYSDQAESPDPRK